MAGLDVAGSVAGKYGDSLGEVVPTAHAFVAVMVEPLMSMVKAAFDDGDNSIGEVASVSWGADLVEDHTE